MEAELATLLKASPNSTERWEKVEAFKEKFEKQVVSEFGDRKMSLRARLSIWGMYFLQGVSIEKDVFRKFLSKGSLSGEKNFLELEMMEGDQVVMVLKDFKKGEIRNTIYLKEGGDCILNLKF